MGGFMVEVRGEWGGAVGGWRPAASGTENQTGMSDAEASTFATYDGAQAWIDYACPTEVDGDLRDNAPRFRIREL